MSELILRRLSRENTPPAQLRSCNTWAKTATRTPRVSAAQRWVQDGRNSVKKNAVVVNSRILPSIITCPTPRKLKSPLCLRRQNLVPAHKARHLIRNRELILSEPRQFLPSQDLANPVQKPGILACCSTFSSTSSPLQDDAAPHNKQPTLLLIFYATTRPFTTNKVHTNARILKFHQCPISKTLKNASQLLWARTDSYQTSASTRGKVQHLPTLNQNRNCFRTVIFRLSSHQQCSSNMSSLRKAAQRDQLQVSTTMLVLQKSWEKRWSFRESAYRKRTLLVGGQVEWAPSQELDMQSGSSNSGCCKQTRRKDAR